MHNPFEYHGVREIHHNEDDMDAAAEEICNLGYTVIDSGFAEDELQLIRAKSESIYAQQVLECGGEENLVRMKDASIARCVISYDDYFVRLAAHQKLLRLVSKLLGENFILLGQNRFVKCVSEVEDADAQSIRISRCPGNPS